MTTTTTVARPNVDVGRGDGIKALLVGAPFLMALGRVLLVPLDDQDWDGVMASMADHRGRSDAGWLLALAASGLLTVTAVILANRAQRRLGPHGHVHHRHHRPRLGRHRSDVPRRHLPVRRRHRDRPRRTSPIPTDFNESAAVGVVFLMAVLAAVGYIVLAVGLARSGTTSKGSTILIAIGGAATLLTMAGPLTPLLVLAALLLTAGHALAARDEQR